MKSFSPAGMATKAYYGRGARTFGNPDGATRGGGAYADGGANPNGPNQGGGGGGGGGGSVIFQMLVDSTNSNGPYDVPNNTSLIDGITTSPIPSPVGVQNLGALNANPIDINSQPIVVFGSVGVGPIWYYTLCLPAPVAQDFWTDITFTTVAGAVVTLTTATADFNGLFNTPGFSIWSWPMPNTGVPPDFVHTNIDITVTWPPTPPILIVAGSASGLPGDVNVGFQAGWPAPAALTSGSFLNTPPSRLATIDDLDGHRFEIVVNNCAITPADFTSVTIVELGLTYTSASAVYIPGCGISTFRWTPFAPFVFGTHYTVNVV